MLSQKKLLRNSPKKSCELVDHMHLGNTTKSTIMCGVSI